MKENIFRKAFYLKSGLFKKDLVPDNGFEVAFVGYSNVGKSSAINILTDQKKLSRVSKTPGKTKLINFYKISYSFKIVDLPGYGFSKISELEKRKIENSLFNFLNFRNSLSRIVLLSDFRYAFKDFDIEVFKISIFRKIPILILLTKSDKLSNFQRNSKIIDIKKQLKKFHFSSIDFFPFSNFNGVGNQDFKEKIYDWYTYYIKVIKICK